MTNASGAIKISTKTRSCNKIIFCMDDPDTSVLISIEIQKMSLKEDMSINKS